ncbi:MAG: DUF58 domain-containing protein [Blastochloris sp.]|nr:DUF58 domain-containing protein [Blastochloris sp.]
MSILESLLEAQKNAAQAAALFRLPFQKRKWRGLAGAWQGKGSGSSIDFKDHRSYLPGDDPRHINWQAYARTGHVSMKVYREEVRPHLDVILDASPSMWNGERKKQRSLELLYFCMENGWKNGSSLRWYIMTSTRWQRGDPRELRSGSWMPPSWEKQTAQMPRWPGVPLVQGGLRVLISDLLFPGSPDTLLNPLCRGAGLSVILSPFSQQESAPDWNGNLEFVDCENGFSRKQRVVAELLSRYEMSYRRHFQLWQRACLQTGCLRAAVRAEPGLPEAFREQALGLGAVEMGH